VPGPKEVLIKGAAAVVVLVDVQIRNALESATLKSNPDSGRAMLLVSSCDAQLCTRAGRRCAAARPRGYQDGTTDGRFDKAFYWHQAW